ncbi:hypothetical protein ACLOJK_003604 [Asimina triloba]
MEAAGVLSELNWSSFSGMEPADDEAAFISQLLDGCPFVNADQDPDPSMVLPSTFLSGREETMIIDDTLHFSNMAMMMNSGMQFWPHDDTSGLFCENYHLGDAKLALPMNDEPSSMDVCVVGEQNISPYLQPVSENQSEYVFCLNEDMDLECLGESGMNPSRAIGVSSQKLQPKRKLKAPKLGEAKLHKDVGCLSESPKKKSREKCNGKKSQPKKVHKHVSVANDQEESVAALNGQNSSSYSSEEDDSNASRELNGAPSSSSKDSSTLNQSGKSRASRRTATDPQSLYARVDISTMLEEAVQYVKFLQLQIKLLSSDELWMYAALAYNGMDIARLNLKMSAPQ